MVVVSFQVSPPFFNAMPASKSTFPPAPEVAPTPSFESAMERLETIVEQMENARLPLEELIRCYEEGIRLIKTCGEQLSAAEQRIEMITRDAAGQPRARDFSPVELTPAAAAATDSPKTKAQNPKSADALASRAARDNEVSLF
jgi:exodeoxyribonuclease VII small subunit